MNSSKAAICQMARSLACEWGPLKIRVNTLSPGYIASPIPKERYEKDPAALKVIEQQNPMGRISTPEEYRGAAVFMLSEASSFMTGSDLIIDGGESRVKDPLTWKVIELGSCIFKRDDEVRKLPQFYQFNYDSAVFEVSDSRADGENRATLNQRIFIILFCYLN